MNCKSFNDLLHEYLDETLDAEVQATAREHLQRCGDCRRALMREEAFAKSLRHSLDRVTAELSVHPETGRNVLKALGSNPTSSNAWLHAWQRFFFIRPARASAAILCVLLLFLGIQLYRPPTKDSVPQRIAQASRYTCVIKVPIQARTHLFRMQNNMVLDAIVTSVTVGHAALFEDRESLSEPRAKSL